MIDFPETSVEDSTWQVPAFRLHELTARKTKHCLCIPVINEGERIISQLAKIKKNRIDETADLLILDGGSTDGSLAEEMLRQNGVRALLIKEGPGRLSAQLRMGYAYALRQGYEGIVTIDGNDKDNVEAIGDFLDGLDKGFGMLQGSRYMPGGEAVNTPLMRVLAVKTIHIPIISLLAGFKYTDTTNGFRGYSRDLLLDNKVQPFRDVFKTYELLAYLSVKAPRLGFRVKELPVRRAYPQKGKIPTKISAFSGNKELLMILWRLALGKYNPV